MELGKESCSHCRRLCSAMFRLVWRSGSGKGREGEGGRKRGREGEGGGREGGQGEALCVSKLEIERKDAWFALSHFDVLAVGFLEQFLIV